MVLIGLPLGVEFCVVCTLCAFSYFPDHCRFVLFYNIVHRHQKGISVTLETVKINNIIMFII